MITPSLALFYLAATLVMAGALGVVLTRNIVHAAFALLASLLGVAGVFLLMFAEFLALVQILIYGGAVVIVVLFSLMLTRIQDFERLTDHRQWPLAAVTAIAVFALLTAGILTTNVRTVERQSVGLDTMGESLFTTWAIPFEVASLVLLVALIGSIVLVRASGERD
jgi:NADH-quinone oxidoreductase subunit J